MEDMKAESALGPFVAGSHCTGRPRFDAADAAPGTDPAAAWASLVHRYGPAGAAARVHGDFALALREPSGRCVLAVDRFATQTMCWRQRNGQFEFAERADQLGDASSLDPQALFDYLYFHVVPSPRTAFEGVHRVPPGHVVVYEHGGVTVQPYWMPTFREPRRPAFAAHREEFKRLLETAVRRQVDGPRAACFLSGGTDSSTIAGMIGVVTGQPAATYSIGFEAEGYDEMEYARVAARHFGTDHHEYYVTPEDLITSIPSVAAWYDAPFGNSSALPALYCARQAHGDGFRQMLAGDGGDELFGGNTRYATHKLFAQYGRVPGVLRKALIEPVFGMPWVQSTPGLKRGSGYIRQANTPLPERMQVFNLLRRLGYANVLTPEFLAQVQVQGVEHQQQQVWTQSAAEHEVDRHLAYDWRYTLGESDLPKVRGTTQMAGVSVGFPMLDDDLVEFSMRLPPHWKLKGFQLRWFFKEALRGFLPDTILTKKKQGFGLPFGVWVTRHARLKELAVAGVEGVRERGLIRDDFARSLIDQHLPEHPSYYGTMVWILMMLEHWLQKHAPAYRLR